MSDDNRWTFFWPTEPGEYWFCGWVSRDKIVGGDEPKVLHVRVHRGGDGGPVYVAEGRFLYRQEGAHGLWLSVVRLDAEGWIAALKQARDAHMIPMAE